MSQPDTTHRKIEPGVDPRAPMDPRAPVDLARHPQDSLSNGSQPTTTYVPEAVVVEGAAGAAASTTPSPVPRDDQTIISNRPPLTAPLSTPMPQPSELRTMLVGERLAHFELQEFIGGGGMGAVFRALDTQLNRLVALKVLAREQSHDDETVRRFRNEAQSAARLDHENIARVFYVGEDRGLYFIAFEHIEGINIRALVERQGPLSVEEAIGYTLQVAEALAHASSRDVVHRDIKPSNILITAEGRAKLVDMGLARVRRVDQPGDDLTASGVTLGTFDYISPEQARDPRVADVRSDIYSLGCTLYFMLTGRPPFPDGTVLQKLLQHQGDTPPDPSQFNPDLPEELCRIVRKMLAKDPRRRYQTPADLLTDLLLLAGDLGWQPPNANGLVWLAPRSQRLTMLERQLPWIAPLAALIAVAVTLHLLWSPAPSPPMPDFSFDERPLASASSDRAMRPAASEKAAAGTAPSGQDASSRPDSSAQEIQQPVDSSANSTPSTSEAADGDRALAPRGDRPEVKTPGTRTDELSDGPSAVPSGEVKSPVLNAGTSRPNVQPTAPRATDADVQSEVIRRDIDPEEVDSEGSDPEDVDPENSDPDDSDPDDSDPDDSDPDDIGRENIGAAAGSPALASDDPGLADGDPPVTVRDETPVAGAAPSAAPATPSAPADRRNVLVVNPSSNDPQVFRTLKAACSQAKTGDIIELRFNGRPAESTPVRLENVRVTIRAGEGYRPVVVFRPNEPDPLKYPRGMIAVSGGRLELVNLALELDVPRRIASDRWSLIEVRRAEMVRLENCSLTIRNASESRLAYHQGVSFIEVTAPPGDGMMMDDASPPLPATNLQLQNCVARGEAVFLRSPSPQPLNLYWENGLLATTEQFYLAAAGSMSRQTSQARFDLRHLTAVVRGGLCLLTSTGNARQHAVPEWRVSNSIVLADPSAALVQQNGVDGTTDFRKGLTWSGNRNFYEGFNVFWRTLPLNPQDRSDEWDRQRWQTFWAMNENPASTRLVMWQRLPDPSRPVNSLTPADYALDMRDGQNPAHRAGDDGRDAGLEPEKLPALPPPPTTPEASVSGVGT
jgi:serine/threonine protein kinase